MTSRIKLKVTAAHIRNGEPSRSNLCPIALALKPRVLPDWIVSVGLRTISFQPADAPDFTAHTCWMSDKMVAFVNKFDKDMKVQPTVFQIDLPDQVVR